MPPHMRGSNHRARGILALAVPFVVAAAVAACGSSAAASPPPPTPLPTPAITPDPHLTEPATADQIWKAISVRGKLPLSVNNATNGSPDSPVVKQINAQIANWPLIITQFRSSADLRKAARWDPSKGAKQGDPPYSWVGLNILIAFGPTTGKLAPPDAAREQQAKDLIALIDPLLWPMEQRSVAPIPTKTAPPPPSPSAPPPASVAP
jgi:hypothetical protein